MESVLDRTTSYQTAREAIEEKHRAGASFPELEETLLGFTELRGDEREALWLYAYGLICRAQRKRG